MTSGRTLSGERRDRAQRALDALGPTRAEEERLTVQCRRAHHLAAVYDTAAGPVVVTRTGPHAHGSKDFVDTGHHGTARVDLVDLLGVGREADDALPAWCDCGPVELSRSALRSALHAGRRTLRVDLP